MKFIKITNQSGPMYFNLEHVSIIDATPTRVKICLTGVGHVVELIGDEAEQFMRQCEEIERREIINEN